MLKCNELKNKWFLELIAFILISKSSQLITPWDTKWPFELSSNKNLDREILEQIKPLNYLLFIHYFRIDHNHLVYPPEFCITYCFQLLLGITVVPREIQDSGYAKFWGAKHGALRSMTCENGELTNIQIRSVSSLQDVIDKSKQKLKPHSHQSWNIFKNCYLNKV